MRILLVEDEHKIAHALKRGLQQEHYAVDLAYDGKEGLGLALSEPYDLVILDRMLPGIEDGLEICAALREKGSHTPVLILTARDKVSDRVKGLDSGADDYLVKPFAFEEFLARVRALLRRPEQRLEKTLQVEDLSLDTISYMVKRKNKSIHLSTKEYALLEYLMRNPNLILSKDTIISHVWDYDADILPNTVEVYIGYLRAKIDKPFKGPRLIHTVRGFGYKLGKAYMFKAAVLRLTLWYLALIMLLSLSFSISLYRVSTNELNTNQKRQTALLSRSFPGDRSASLLELNRARLAQLETSRAHIEQNLLYFNLIIFLLGGLLSFALARRTLRPIEKALESQQRFTADASHELRTPLTAMKTEIEVALRDESLTLAESKRLHRSTLEEIENLERLSSGLLTLAQHETLVHTPEFSICAISDVVREAMDRSAASAKKHSITLVNSVKDELVEGDHWSLVELLTILLDNAIKYSPKGSSVEIGSAFQHHKQQVVISITDQGAGISQEDLPRIFTRFYRADLSRSKEAIAGYGLGLSIAKKIVDLHHGSIEVKSKAGNGSTFSVILPVKQPRKRTR